MTGCDRANDLDSRSHHLHTEPNRTELHTVLIDLQSQELGNGRALFGAVSSTRFHMLIAIGQLILLAKTKIAMESIQARTTAKPKL